MSLFNFILWDASPEIYSIGDVTLRWYGLLFALGFLLGQQILIRIYKLEGKSEKHVETLTIYMVIATIIGARLGHCLFYEPHYYLRNPVEILKIWEGGLASHGATLGILIAIYIYSRREVGQNYLYVLDRLVIVVALAGCLIRLGNLMNSEIIGRPTNIATAFIFSHSTQNRLAEEYDKHFEGIEVTLNGKDSIRPDGQILAGLDISFFVPNSKITEERVNNFVQSGLRETLMNVPDYNEHVVVPDREINFSYEFDQEAGGAYVSAEFYGIPRHPAQFYESISSLLLFFLLLFIYLKKKGGTPEGRLFGLFIVILFSLRFLYEFLKEPQVRFEEEMIFNMGQLLSIPLIIAGFFILLRSYRKKNEVI